MSESEKRKHGFAAMDPERQRELARQGGIRAHQIGTAHTFTPEEAREAGRKGGTKISQDREHMREIGTMGGMTKKSKRAASRASRDF